MIGELARNLHGAISYVSMAGTKSGIGQMIAPELEALGYFKVALGMGTTPICFNNSYLEQVSTKVTLSAIFPTTLM